MVNGWKVRKKRCVGGRVSGVEVIVAMQTALLVMLNAGTMQVGILTTAITTVQY